jgi:hypothetical protein
VTKKNLSLLGTLIGLLLLVTAGISGAGGTNYVELHKNSGTITDAGCINCHGDKKTEQSLDSSYQTFHYKHLNSTLLDFTCNKCHSTTDIVEGSSFAYRRQVSADGNSMSGKPVGCMACHGQFPSKGPGGMTLDSRCWDCHAKYNHVGSFVVQSQLNGESRLNGGNCTKCHGELAWYQRAEVY